MHKSPHSGLIKTLALAWLALNLLCTALPASASSTHRCGSKLVSLGDSAYTVSQVCGTPLSIDELGYTVMRDNYGYRYEVKVEEWSYGPKNGMYYFLRFTDGKLSAIKSSR